MQKWKDEIHIRKHPDLDNINQADSDSADEDKSDGLLSGEASQELEK